MSRVSDAVDADVELVRVRIHRVVRLTVMFGGAVDDERVARFAAERIGKRRAGDDDLLAPAARSAR